MIKSARRVFFCSWIFESGKDCFLSSQSSPLHQGLVGSLIWAEEWKYGLTIFNHTYLEFIHGCHKGVVPPYQKLWGQIHKVEHAVTEKGPRYTRVQKHFSYYSQTVWYQGFLSTFVTQISWLPTWVILGRDGVPEHLLPQHDILICCQNREKV